MQPRYQRVVLPNFWPSRAKEGSQARDDMREPKRDDNDVAVEDEDA